MKKGTYSFFFKDTLILMNPVIFLYKTKEKKNPKNPTNYKIFKLKLLSQRFLNIPCFLLKIRLTYILYTRYTHNLLAINNELPITGSENELFQLKSGLNILF